MGEIDGLPAAMRPPWHIITSVMKRGRTERYLCAISRPPVFVLVRSTVSRGGFRDPRGAPVSRVRGQGSRISVRWPFTKLPRAARGGNVASRSAPHT